MTSVPRVLELTEYQSCILPAHELAQETAIALAERYGNQVRVNRLWRQQDAWELTSLGHVGYIPVNDRLHLALRPKMPLTKLFEMLEYAYQVGRFLKDDLVSVESLQELYERLAIVLARRVIDRTRKGLYRAYLSRREALGFVRGRVDIRQHSNRPWLPHLPCEFEEHTPDIADNQILAWTLFLIARSGVCTERSKSDITRAFRGLHGATVLTHFQASDCLGFLYNRLNSDYEPLHALCRFFLGNAGPTYESGDRSMVPFVINMASLFEMFVAEWLQAHAPPEVRFQSHHKFTWDRANGTYSDIDLIVTDPTGSQVLAVLDTKYKTPDKPSEDDVYQIVFYALNMSCKEAILVYPQQLTSHVDTLVRGIRVRSIAFDVGEDLDSGGQRFLDSLYRQSLHRDG